MEISVRFVQLTLLEVHSVRKEVNSVRFKVSWSEVTNLEEKTKFWFSTRRDLIEKVSSELQVSANPPGFYTGKGQKRKNANLQLKKYEEGEYILRWKRKKLPYQIIFALACQSWYYPDDIRAAVQFLILEERKRFNLCHEELDLVLSNKGQSILYLQEKVHLKGWNWYFGSIMTDTWSIRRKDGSTQVLHLDDILPKYYYQLKKKPKPVQRHRGYRDHGSLGDLNIRARREELRKDFTTLQEEQLMEQRIKKHTGLIGLLKGWFS